MPNRSVDTTFLSKVVLVVQMVKSTYSVASAMDESCSGDGSSDDAPNHAALNRAAMRMLSRVGIDNTA